MYGGQLREFVFDYVNKGTPLYNGILHKMRPFSWSPLFSGGTKFKRTIFMRVWS